MARSDKAQRTRERLVQAAAERFAVDGYAGTSFASLVKASGQSKGAFYHHFSSKLDLALAAFRAKQDQLIRAATVGARKGTPLERLLGTLEARARAYTRDPTLRVLPRLSTEFAQDPELAPVVTELHGNAIRVFEELVRNGQESGEIRQDLDPHAVARTIFAAIVGMDELSQRESGGKDLLDRGRDLNRLLRSALEVRESPQRSGRSSNS